MTATTPTLADFAAWLVDTQQLALRGMRTTTGEAFALHSSDFIMLATAINALHQFQLGAVHALASASINTTGGRA